MCLLVYKKGQKREQKRAKIIDILCRKRKAFGKTTSKKKMKIAMQWERPSWNKQAPVMFS